MTRVGLTQRVTEADAYEERRDCLDQEWTVLLEELDIVPVPLANRVGSVGTYLDSFSLDGIILTSGNDLSHLDDPRNPAPERDEFEDATVSYAVNARLPLLGVCRGLEFINVWFGGSLISVNGHVDEDHPVYFDESRNAFESTVDFPESMVVNSYHDIGIAREDVASELTVLATAGDETVEFVGHPMLPVWGIMWHPERGSPSSAFDRKLLARIFKGDR